MAPIKAGDVVILKSGSPEMTVSYVSQDGECDCNWFVGSEAKSKTFTKESLVKVR